MIPPPVRVRPWPAWRGPRPATLGGWLKKAEELYARHGAALGQISPLAHDEALYLLLHTLGLPLESGPDVLALRLSRGQSDAAETVLRRRLEDRVPAAYLTGEAWLGGLRFFVDERVLIPRSYFVELIARGLDEWLADPDPAGVTRVADVCTGSGCLAILLARHFRRAEVDAIDLSPAALEVAKTNVRRHRLSGRVHLHRSDLFAGVPPVRYDLILSNPPYEPSAIVDSLPPEFRREPRLALDGGADGLGIIRPLLRQAASRLRPGGILVVEIGGLRQAMDHEFAGLGLQWLSTEDGTDCVALVHAARLAAFFAGPKTGRPAGAERSRTTP